MTKNTKGLALNKKYIWCFMGQVHAQGERAKMIEGLKKTGGEYYYNVNFSWQSKDSLSTENYKRILEQSIFVPCPRGNSSVDTFRLYEALEAKSIPIVESDKYWNNLFGEENPFIQCDSWDKVADDIMVLHQDAKWLEQYSIKLFSWWKTYKLSLKNEIKKTISQYDSNPLKNKNFSISEKVKEFISLKNQWQNFKDYNFFNYIAHEIPKLKPPKNKFDTYNANQKIAIVSLYTKEIADHAVHSEISIKKYCEKQGYTFYIYREKIEENSNPNWSKAQALLNHIDDHEYVIWMDSDTLIFNPEKTFESIIQKAPKKFILATKDIGGNSMLNSGVLFFKSHNYTKNLIKRWRDFNGDKSSLYSSGGDQEILCSILKKSDKAGFNRKIFEMNEFNTDPRLVDNDTFILHFMAYPQELKKIFMGYWNN